MSKRKPKIFLVHFIYNPNTGETITAERNIIATCNGEGDAYNIATLLKKYTYTPEYFPRERSEKNNHFYAITVEYK